MKFIFLTEENLLTYGRKSNRIRNAIRLCSNGSIKKEYNFVICLCIICSILFTRAKILFFLIQNAKWKHFFDFFFLLTTKAHKGVSQRDTKDFVCLCENTSCAFVVKRGKKNPPRKTISHFVR